VRAGLTSSLRLAPIALGGLAALWATGPHGPGLSPDSAAYLSEASNLHDGLGLVPYTGYADATFPPGYPGALSAVMAVTGASATTAARIVGIAAIAGAAAFAAVLVIQNVRPRGAQLAIIAGVALAPPMVVIASWGWSEAVFLLFSTACLLALARYDQRGDLWPFFGSALAAAAAISVRWSGVALLVPGAIFAARTGPARRWSMRALWLSIPGAVLAALLISNLIRADSLTGVRQSPEEGFVSQIGHLGRTLLSWVAPGPPLVPLAIVALAIAATWRFVGLGAMVNGLRHAVRRDVLAVFSVAYLAVLLASAATTTIDPLDDRLLAPLFVPLVVLVVRTADEITPRLARGALVIAAGSALWALGQAVRSFDELEDLHRDGGGYAAARWQQSPTARSVPAAGGLRYSNAPDALWLVSGGQTLCLPAQFGQCPVLRPVNEPPVRDRSRFVTLDAASGHLPVGRLRAAGIRTVPIARYRDGRVFRLRATG
jgi:hypothetical protein